MATASTPMLCTSSHSLEQYTPMIQNLLNYNLLNDGEHQKEINEAIVNLFRCLLDASTLVELERSVASRDPASSCVCVPITTEVYLQFCNIKLPAQLFAARIWRFHDLNINSQLKPISTCKSFNGMSSDELCINPYHYERFDSAELDPANCVQQTFWASISYYELKERIGEAFHAASTVSELVVDGYTDPSTANRFCLGVLSNINRKPEVELTRRHIGRGIKLYNKGNEVICECLSDNPVFVQSPIRNKQNNWHIATVCKVPPSCSFSIFDMNYFSELLAESIDKGFEEVYHLTRLCAIRISFVKGWGAEYRRQTVLNTPCWIEIHLNNPLKWIDSILTKIGSPQTNINSFS